ncbi:prepilin-type N-terminal cleavage/methylation domain-containing protein [Agaribacter marinus]|uniref:Prepilin-type N-terminal cleavage/methylation domain-containing protein n=1 Tax=Agaribacter marinus TaxID=1431249 RepID=A0AA37SZM1_9ALTE|nr:prepilin-type N-terminal cleavage/methylation domain-containing protein [Agaribacter marinus]GLR71304.1 hypothetical protein GCM10007852_22120 [Agaribacter marinus]
MLAKYHGFTLIELIIVIVILGVIAVIAAPKFIDVSVDARIAKLESLAGSMRTAANLANYKAEIDNKTDCASDPTIEMGGQTITLRCGYPCPHPSGIARAVTADDDSYQWIGGNCAGQLGAIDVRLRNAQDPSDCRVRYTSARSDRAARVEIFSDGC